jgi:tetratricopeptide (TPR) repeat protein
MEKMDTAESLLRQGKYQEAIELYEEIHRAYPEEESVLLMLAWAYYDSGSKAQAVDYLEILLERELRRKVFTGFAYDELVRIYKQEKNFGKLIEICERAVTAQPDDPGLLAELGNAYLQADQATNACNTYKKLVQMEDDNTAFYCRWGEALFAAGSVQESEAAYLRAAEIDPNQADQYFFKMAVLFIQAGNNNEAKKLLEKCIAANSHQSIYHCCLGDALIGLGKIEEAIAEYKNAVQSDEKSSSAYFHRLGNSLMKAKYFSQAVDIFQTALTYKDV